MALEADLRAILEQTLDSQLRCIERKFLKGTEGAEAGLVPARLEELRRLCQHMSNNVLQRIATRAPEWEVHRGEDLQGASTSVSRAEHVRFEARVQELEAQLQAKQAEVAQRHDRLFAHCQADFDEALTVHEQQLRAMQQQATSTEAEGARKSVAERGGQFAEHMDIIKSRLLATKQVVADLNDRRKGLEKIEALQQCGLMPIEALLAGGAKDGPSDDEEDAILAAIQRGEQVCKRMRRHIPTGA